MKDHLWVVISDPFVDLDQIVMVNFTSHKPWKDDSCILRRGEHQFISHETSIFYREARHYSEQRLSELYAENKIIRQEPVSDEVLGRIRKGMIKSRHAPRKFKRILREQGLVE